MKTKSRRHEASISRQRPTRMSDWVRHMLAAHPPRLTFRGRTRRDFQRWQPAFRSRYHEMLGAFPAPVPLRPRVISSRDYRGFTVEKVIFDTERGLSVPAWVGLPRPLPRARRCPAVVCCHGHGHGARGIMGVDPRGRPVIESMYKELGIRLARQGYVTIAPDWRIFGERAERPGQVPKHCDPCNLAHLAAEHFGYQLLALDLWDAMRAVDYLATRREVDAGRIGCVGLSFGGTMSLHLAARDRRIRAACISGYFGGTGDSLKRWNTCGSQTLPGLLKWGDRAELAGLICPRAALVQIGEYDSVFASDSCRREYARLEAIYRAAGAPSKLAMDFFEGVHEINFAPVLQWLDRWLKRPS